MGFRILCLIFVVFRCCLLRSRATATIYTSTHLAKQMKNVVFSSFWINLSSSFRFLCVQMMAFKFDVDVFTLHTSPMIPSLFYAQTHSHTDNFFLSLYLSARFFISVFLYLSVLFSSLDMQWILIPYPIHAAMSYCAMCERGLFQSKYQNGVHVFRSGIFI